MAYDSKSNIGQQTANPGNPQIGQATVYEQKISSVPLLERQTSSIALQERQTSSVALLERQTSSIQLGQNTARQIDLLSMEQFGHNQSVLRKDLSILEANSVNTDKEYGVMQVEDRFEFDAITDIVTIPDVDTSLMFNSYLSNILLSKMDKAKVSLMNIEQGIGASVVFSHPFYAYDKFGGFQFIKYNSASQPVIKINGTAIEEDSNNILQTLDSNNKLKQTIDGFNGYFDSTINKIDFTLENKDSTRSIFLWIRWRYHWYDPFTIVESAKEIKPGDPIYSFNADWGTGDRAIVEISLGESASDSEFILYNPDGSGDGQSDTNRYAFRLNTVNADAWQYNYTIGKWIKYSAPINMSNIEFPECIISLRLRDDGAGDTGVKSINLSKSGKIPDTKVSLWKEDKATKVFDYSNNNYFYGAEVSATNPVVGFDPITVSYSDSNFISIARMKDTIQTYLFRIALSQSAKLTTFIKLVDVNEYIKIGLANREDSSVQICVKYNDRFITASNDTVLENGGATLENIYSIGSTNNSVSFVCNISGVQYYYMFTLYSEIGLGVVYDELTQSLPYFIRIATGSVNNLESNILSVSKAAGDRHVSYNTISIDDNIYIKNSKSGDAKLTKLKNVVSTSLSSSFLKESFTVILDAIKYVISNPVIPVPFGVSYGLDNMMSAGFGYHSFMIGRCFISILKLPSLDNETGEYSTLPLRLVDEFPEISKSASVGYKIVNIGKTSFAVCFNGIYKSSNLRLTADPSMCLISNTGTYFNIAENIIHVKDGLSSVYNFTEYGLELLLNIEDEIICNPVRTSVGIIMCGRTGIWTLTKDGVVKIWKSAKTILQASLKTDLDNSCIAVIDDDSFDTQVLAGSDGTGDNYSVLASVEEEPITYPVCCGTSIFTAVTINQFGFVSSQKINTNLNTVDFIDIGAESELLILDLVGSGSLNTLVKGDMTETSFTIQSNQQIEMYQETVHATLNKIRLFAKGSGTITVTVNDIIVGSVTVSGTRFEEYSLTLNADMNMLDYKITCTTGVKLMQRVVGIITTKEEFYG